jgi:PIN domain nuclease of toxin-antitoxin system
MTKHVLHHSAIKHVVERGPQAEENKKHLVNGIITPVTLHKLVGDLFRTHDLDAQNVKQILRSLFVTTVKLDAELATTAALDPATRELSAEYQLAYALAKRERVDLVTCDSTHEAPATAVRCINTAKS